MKSNIKTKKSHVALISMGILNAIHGIFHIIQFVQSMFLVVHSTEPDASHENNYLDTFFHSPIMAFVWATIGILSLIIGIRDYRHHKKCNHEH